MVKIPNSEGRIDHIPHAITKVWGYVFIIDLIPCYALEGSRASHRW